MDRRRSDSFDDISGDESEVMKELHDAEDDSFWTNCKGRQICAMGTDNDDEDDCFDISPASPIDGEIVINPPMPLEPLINNSNSKRDRLGSYGSTNSCDTQQLIAENDIDNESCSATTEEVPKILSAVSSHLTIMIEREVPLYLESNEPNSNEDNAICVSNAVIVLNGRHDLDNPPSTGTINEVHDDGLQGEHVARSSEGDSIFNVSENRKCDSLINVANKQTDERARSPPDDSKSRESVTSSLNIHGCDSELDSIPDISVEGDSEEIFQIDDIDEKPKVTLQRSTSLKTCKTPPGTPNRKKIVRFADAMGLDLEAVKQITQEDLPRVPKSAYEDLELSDLFDSPGESPVGSYTNSNSLSVRKFYVPFEPSKFGQLSINDAGGARNLQTMFTVPGNMPNFIERVMTNKVCLEKVTVSELSITCIVRVANIHFEKKVTARFTTNEWASYDDISANYISGGSNADGTDQFSFTIYAPYLSIGQRLCFALRFVVDGQHHWDNNFGSNYCFKCQSEYSDVGQDDTVGWLHFL